MTYSSLVAVNGRLLAIGGRNSQAKPTADFHQYNPTIDSWEVVSQMSAPSFDLHAAVLRGNKIMIIRLCARNDIIVEIKLPHLNKLILYCCCC